MLGLAARGVCPTVVADQIGRPTFATDIADAIVHLLRSRAPYGTLPRHRRRRARVLGRRGPGGVRRRRARRAAGESTPVPRSTSRASPDAAPARATACWTARRPSAPVSPCPTGATASPRTSAAPDRRRAPVRHRTARRRGNPAARQPRPGRGNPAARQPGGERRRHPTSRRPERPPVPMTRPAPPGSVAGTVVPWPSERVFQAVPGGPRRPFGAETDATRSAPVPRSCARAPSGCTERVLRDGRPRTQGHHAHPLVTAHTQWSPRAALWSPQTQWPTAHVAVTAQPSGTAHTL